MKRCVLLGAAALAGALLFGSMAANAADIDINLGVAATQQKSADVVNQVAGSGDISIGSVSASNLASTAANLNNDLDQAVDVSNLQSTTYGGEAGLSVASQISQKVNQTAISVNGEGAVSGSTLASTAANINNDAQVRVTVH